MRCVVIDLCCVRIAVVQVAPALLAEPQSTRTIRELQPRFGVVPLLLVSFDAPDMSDVRGYSEFPAADYVADLLDWHGIEPIEWETLPEPVEEELPF